MNDLAERVALAFIAAINRHDVDELAGLMTPGHNFVDSLGNVVEGREKMRAGWAGYFGTVPDYLITVLKHSAKAESLSCLVSQRVLCPGWRV